MKIIRPEQAAPLRERPAPRRNFVSLLLRFLLMLAAIVAIMAFAWSR